MKKIVLITFAFAIVFLSCNSNRSSNLSSTDSISNMDVKRSTINDFRTVNNIPLDTAEKMVHRYKNHAGTVLIDSRTPPKDNSRCVWFDIDTLKKLVDGIKLDSGDGVRMYFATYSDKEKPHIHRGQSYDVRKYNTLVLISTKPFPKTDSNHHHLDYYNGNTGFLMLSEPQNKGELYPPGQDEGALFLQNNGFTKK